MRCLCAEKTEKNCATIELRSLLRRSLRGGLKARLAVVSFSPAGSSPRALSGAWCPAPLPCGCGRSPVASLLAGVLALLACSRPGGAVALGSGSARGRAGLNKALGRGRALARAPAGGLADANGRPAGALARAWRCSSCVGSRSPAAPFESPRPPRTRC